MSAIRQPFSHDIPDIVAVAGADEQLLAGRQEKHVAFGAPDVPQLDDVRTVYSYKMLFREDFEQFFDGQVCDDAPAGQKDAQVIAQCLHILDVREQHLFEALVGFEIGESGFDRRGFGHRRSCIVVGSSRESLANATDRFQKSVESDGFQQVIGHTKFKAVEGMARVCGGHYHKRVRGGKGFQKLDTVHLGHVDIQENNMRRQGRQFGKCHDGIIESTGQFQEGNAADVLFEQFLCQRFILYNGTAKSIGHVGSDL